MIKELKQFSIFGVADLTNAKFESDFDFYTANKVQIYIGIKE